MITETIRFEPVRTTVRKTVKCPSCGKSVKRQRTFWQTLNPWNKNAQGLPKTTLEILREQQMQAAEWKQQPETCTPCLEAAD